MQKNVPKYTPDVVRTVTIWAETSKRDVSYALCNDRRTLLWFANQRAVEYHPTLVRAPTGSTASTHLVLDLDPPEGDASPMAVARRPPRPPGARRRRARRRGQDQRREGRARVRARSTTRRRRGRRPRPPARSRRAPSGSIPRWPPPRSSRRTAAARCSSTPPGSAARPWSPPTARGSGRACRCRSRSPGTSSTTCRRPTSPSTPRRRCSATRDPWADADAGTAVAAAPTWSRRATPSRSPGCRRCTRASAVPAPGAGGRAPSSAQRQRRPTCGPSAGAAGDRFRQRVAADRTIALATFRKLGPSADRQRGGRALSPRCERLPARPGVAPFSTTLERFRS